MKKTYTHLLKILNLIFYASILLKVHSSLANTWVEKNRTEKHPVFAILSSFPQYYYMLFFNKKIYLFVFVPTIWLVNEPTSLYINSLLRIDKNVCTTITFKKGDRWMYRWRCENWKWGKNNVKLFYWNIYPPKFIQCWRQCDATNFGSWQDFYLTLFSCHFHLLAIQRIFLFMLQYLSVSILYTV